MAGLNLQMSGVGSTRPSSYGSVPSSPARTAQEAAFGPGVTVPTDQAQNPLMPNNGVGVAFWSGVVAIGLLALVRKSLPR